MAEGGGEPTPWAGRLLDEAIELERAHRPRSAMEKVLTILSVHPDSRPAATEAGHLLQRYARTNAQVADDSERLTARFTDDRRLDHLVCVCDTDGCTAWWISPRVLAPDRDIIVADAVGGRCYGCGRYSCRRHFARGRWFSRPVVATCRHCGGALEAAPPPNGRRPRQTVRLNQPLVHVHVLVEGSGAPDGRWITRLCESVAPDVSEDGPTLTATPAPSTEKIWGHDGGEMQVAALVTRDHHEYLGPDYDLRLEHGLATERPRARWAMAKVFACRPKHVDPGA